MDAGTDKTLDRRDAQERDGRADSGRDGGSDARLDGRSNLPDAERDGACVPLGGVTFRMEAPPTDAGYYYLYSLGNPGDGVWWYSVETPDGSVLPIFLLSDTPSTCNSCRDIATPIGQGCAALIDGGVAGGWSGYAVTGMATCEVPATSYASAHPSTCATISCLPAGRYVVKMCAGRGRCVYSSDAATCLSIPFDFPGTSEVVGTLPP
jgi:hypothetical protein